MNKMIDESDEPILTPAERHYQSVKKASGRYQKSHPEQVSERNKRAYNRLKEERPEEYELKLKAKRELYQLKKLAKNNVLI